VGVRKSVEWDGLVVVQMIANSGSTCCVQWKRSGHGLDWAVDESREQNKFHTGFP
jgi:hypothetical protein